jgi:hypothetical protein
MITVQISKEERLNLSMRAFMLMDEVKVKKEEMKELGKEVKKTTAEIEKIATWVRTGTKEVPNGEQQDLLQQPVGAQAAADAFKDLANKAEAAAAATGSAEPPSWTPEQHADACPAKLGPLHGCVPACGWNRAHGGPVAEAPFEASEAELAAQSGRKKGKKAA